MRGVAYVAYGGPARASVQTAIESFRRHMPGIPVALVSDRPTGWEDIFIPHPDSDLGGRHPKTELGRLVPDSWHYCLYLDADTEVVADISFLYQLVEDGWEMAITRNPSRFHTVLGMARPDNMDECEATWRILGCTELLQFNGGVLAWRRTERVLAWWDVWHEEWLRWGKRDQAALLRALWRVPLRLYVLGNEWNTFPRYQPVSVTAGILHYPTRARRWTGILHGRLDSPEVRNGVCNRE